MYGTLLYNVLQGIACKSAKIQFAHNIPEVSFETVISTIVEKKTYTLYAKAQQIGRNWRYKILYVCIIKTFK